MNAAPSRKELTHDRIVDVAARVIRRAGYHKVGVADVMKEAGLTHGGFYAHFASRDALLVEAMARAGRDSGAVIAARLAQRRAQGVGPFAALIESYLSDEHMAGAEHGCMVAALASEMPRLDEEVADAARVGVLRLIDLVRHVLPSDVDGGQAPVIASSMVGALQLARVLGGKAGRALLAASRQQLLSQYDPRSAR